MFNLALILDSVCTARDITAAARDNWNNEAVDTEAWPIARRTYLDAEEKQAASTRRLLRLIKVLFGTDTLYLYLDFPFLTAEQRTLLTDVLRENRHERVLETEAMPSNDFVALANAWKLERDRVSAGRELVDIGQHHEDIDAVIKHRAEQLHPRGWKETIRAFRITRQMIAEMRSLSAGCTLNAKEMELAAQDAACTAIDAVKSRAELRLTKLTNEIDRILAPRLKYPYLLNALLESILPVQINSSSDDFDEESVAIDPGSAVGNQLNQPEDSDSFQKRLEEARAVVEALRSYIRQPNPTKPESKFSVPVTTMVEGEEEVAEQTDLDEPGEQNEPEGDSDTEEEVEQVEVEFQAEASTMTAAEIEKLFNQS